MIVNGKGLLKAKPIKDMLTSKQRAFGVSHGLAEAGYDIRVKQDIMFRTYPNGMARVSVDGAWPVDGRFTMASAIEEFDLPRYLVGVVHDKSTWARQGLSVFNTVLEPGWKGFLTLELVWHGSGVLHIPAGAGIAQVLFSEVEESAAYNGKYQHQEDAIVGARFEHGEVVA
jgi:dCTP deaminase